MKLTNNTGISLSLAVWLAEDTYDHNADPKYLSATGLLKPTRQIILKARAPYNEIERDISQDVASSSGTAFHEAIERSWKNNYAKSLLKLGYPKDIIERIAINPTELKPDTIPVYMEIRSVKEISGYKVGGKFDFVGEGILEDFKSTGVYSYMQGNKDQDYILQGSIYRWLNPEIITSDVMKIQFIFTDWSKLRSMIEKDKGYPQQRVLTHKLKLMSIEDTEHWIKEKIADITKFLKVPEDQLPECTREELWQKPSVFSYYKDPNKRTRATRNFDAYNLAYERYILDGSVGVIVEKKGQVRACEYCGGFDLCTQKDAYIADGSLII